MAVTLVEAAKLSNSTLQAGVIKTFVNESVVLDRRGDAERESRFDDNYAFFRSQVHVDEVARIWRGLQRLEHVSITLGAGANAQ